MIAGVPPKYIQENGPWIDGYMMVALDVMKRFGRWDDILKEPKPPKELPITTAWWYFSRAIAQAAKGNVSEAEREQKAFRAAVGKVPQDAKMAINPAHKVLTIAEHFLEGEIAYRKGDMDRSVAELRKAIAVEDDLLYMEPPEWIQPARHTLGAFLVSKGRWAEAEAVYREDLEIWPENGWSLHGLAQCLRAQGKTDEASAVQARFAQAWKRSDTNIGTSCMCVPEVAAAR
jgi:tetratricopeptide (TPR) repeat protein